MMVHNAKAQRMRGGIAEIARKAFAIDGMPLYAKAQRMRGGIAEAARKAVAAGGMRLVLAIAYTGVL